MLGKTVITIIAGCGVLVIFLGAPATFVAMQKSLEDMQSVHEWPYAHGWITESYYTTSEFVDNPKYANVHVKYTYTVDNQAYLSGRIRIDGNYTVFESGQNFTISEARIITGYRYALESPVRVYYDPIDPSNATLERAEVDGPLTQYVLTALVVVLGQLLIIYAIFRAMPPANGAGPVTGPTGSTLVFQDPGRADRSVRSARFFVIAVAVGLATIQIAMALSGDLKAAYSYTFAFVLLLIPLAWWLYMKAFRVNGIVIISGPATVLNSIESPYSEHALKAFHYHFQIDQSTYAKIAQCDAPTVEVRFWRTDYIPWLHSIWLLEDDGNQTSLGESESTSIAPETRK